MDAVLYWNDVALEANRISHTNGKGEQTGPPLSARALAIVHLAIYDAFAGASGNGPGLAAYLPTLPAAPPVVSPDAAVASAAHTALSALFPSQKVMFDAGRAAFAITGSAEEIQNGTMYGYKVAQAILADRSGDPGGGNSTGYVASTARGRHRPDPDNPDQGFGAPFYGAEAKCFAVTKRWGVDKPPMPGDVEYQAALHQVRAKGIAPELMGTLPSGAAKRTPEETLKGLFWAYDGAVNLGTPPRFYNRIVRAVAEARGNSVAQNARLFALVNTAMADAGILAWEQKYIHDLWRPVVGIREDDTSMGTDGVGGNHISAETDPNWLPLGAPKTNELGKNFTPNFPAYPSGHATFGAAALGITRRFYGVSTHAPDHLADGLELVSEELNGINKDNKGAVRPRHVRTFPKGLWGMIRENSLSRVFLGVHWIFDGFLPGPGDSIDLSQNVGGVPLGLRIADDIFTTGLTKSTV
jgi:membrane-associated phospholipid phosphatase/phage tail protein X